MKRADVELVRRGLARSRAQAQSWIEEGSVYLNKNRLTKASQLVAELDELTVARPDGSRFVSRGGEKLDGALERARLDVRGWRALDVGVSTGGFSDCLLQRGAAFVLGVDVGRGQLAASLRGHARLRTIEGMNARELISAEIAREAGPEPFDLVVADVSFISLTLVLPSAVRYLKAGGRILALVKPQFEVGPEGVGKGGIVKDPAQLEKARAKILDYVRSASLRAEDFFESSIKGGNGNSEFFIHATKP